MGAGTGCFALLASENGFQVTGLEPAKASLELARKKPNAHLVNWIHGTAPTLALTLPSPCADLAVMTGNVAQVFLSDQHWEENLKAIRKALKADGHLVFEVRDPSQKSWKEWTKERTFLRTDIPGCGIVESWCEVLEMKNQLLTFRWTYKFETDGEVIRSDSTLRFREKNEIESSLKKSGFMVREVRGAPDRPDKEFVFIAGLAT